MKSANLPRKKADVCSLVYNSLCIDFKKQETACKQNNQILLPDAYK